MDVEDSDTLKFLFFSLIGCSISAEIFIIVSYLSIRKKSTVFYNQVIWLISTDIISLFATFYALNPNIKDDFSCKTAGFIRHITHVSSIIWTSVIAGSIFNSIIKRRQIGSIGSGYIVITKIISLLFAFVPLFLNSYGIYNGYPFVICWIHEKDTTAIIISNWIPLVTTFLLNIYFYIGILIYLTRNHSKSVSKEFSILLVFPLVQMLTNFGTFVYTIHILNGGNSLSMNIQTFHVVSKSCEGLLNVIAYGSNYSVRKEIAKVWCSRRINKKAIREELSSSVLGDHSSPFASLGTVVMKD